MIKSNGFFGKLLGFGALFFHLPVRSESDQPRFEGALKARGDIHHGDAEGTAEPLVGSGDQGVDAAIGARPSATA